MQFSVEEAIDHLHGGHNRAAAAEALGRSGDCRALLPLIQVLPDCNASECAAVARALGKLGDGRAASALRTMLSSPEGVCRIAAAEALGRLRDVVSIGLLLELLLEKDPHVREAAARALGEIRDVRALPRLTQLLVDRRSEVREAAATALGGRPDVRRVVSYLRRVTSQVSGSPPPVTPDRDTPPQALLSAVAEWTAQMRADVSKTLSEAFDALVRWPGGGSWLRALRDLDDPRTLLALMEGVRRHHGRTDRSDLDAVLGELARLGPDGVAEPLLAWALTDVAEQQTWPFGEREYHIADPAVRRLLAGWPHSTLRALFRVLEPADIGQCKAAADLLRHMDQVALAEGMLATLAGGPATAIPRLVALASSDPDLRTRVAAGWVSLRRAGIEPLGALLERGLGWTALWAAEALGRIGGPAARERFLALWESDDAGRRLAAAVGLAHLRDARGIRLLLAALGSAEPQERLAAAAALGGLREAGAEGLGALRAMQRTDPDRGVAAACREAVRIIEASLRGARAELEAAPPPAGRGDELEAVTAGRGTELESDA